MKRKIIKIDQDKCNGCGNCIPGCPEGALQMIDGKARLISDLFCDGLGACIGECPVGAIVIEEREAEQYDEAKVMENIVRQGDNTIRAHLKHLKDHGEHKFLGIAMQVLKEKGINIALEEEKKGHGGSACGCPGSKTMTFVKKTESHGAKGGDIESELRQWPVQLTLQNPDAPYFENAELLIAADCVPFAYPNFHQKLLANKVLIILCPKLDKNIDDYISKLTYIFKNRNIKSVTIARMEVPCCGGVSMIVNEAMKQAEKNIPVINYTIEIGGNIK